jgi:hypothetical protein
MAASKVSAAETVGLAALAVLLLLAAAALPAARRRQRAHEPAFAAEVFFARPGAPGLAGAAPATPAQVRRLLAEGGARPPGAGWRALYGPRPRRGAPGVAPFAPGVWFHPGGPARPGASG